LRAGIRSLVSMLKFRFLDRVFAMDNAIEATLRNFFGSKGLSFERASPSELSEMTFSLERSGAGYNLYQGEVRLAREQPLEFALELFFCRLRSVLPSLTGGLTYLRADTIKKADGKAILICGPSLSGKSRLAEALTRILHCQPWCSYYSPLTDAGEVIEFPSSRRSEEGLEIDAILNIQYVPGAELNIESVSPGKAVLSTLPQVVWPKNGRAVLDCLSSASPSFKRNYVGSRGGLCPRTLDTLKDIFS